MEQNKIQVNGGTTISVDVTVKNSCIWERLCLESCYM